MQRTGRTAATTLAVVGLAVSACSSSPDPSKASASTTPFRSATATATEPDAQQTARTQVIAFIPAYLRMIDDLHSDANRPLDDIYQVATTPEANTEATAIGKFRAQGYRQTGQSRLVAASADRVSLGTNASASPSPSTPTVVVTACVDVSHVDAVDSSGHSVVTPGRPGYLVEELTVVNPHYPDAASWRVSEAPNRQAQSCSG